MIFDPYVLVSTAGGPAATSAANVYAVPSRLNSFVTPVKVGVPDMKSKTPPFVTLTAVVTVSKVMDESVALAGPDATRKPVPHPVIRIFDTNVWLDMVPAAVELMGVPI